MLRNLVHEIVRRRLWPIPVLALLVAVAAPVLFLKSAPAGAPAAQTAAPVPATAGELPARAQRLLAATGNGASRGGATGPRRDPFKAPSSHAASKAGASGSGAAAKTTTSGSGGSGSSAATGTDPVPVVIQNADGTPLTTTTTPATTTPGTNPSTSTPALTAANAAVDIRFAERAGGAVHRAIPRLQTYFVHGKLAAVFVKYSPSRGKAVFAISPNVLVSGPVKCRRIEGVCRYVDIPSGSYARLTMLTPDRIVVHRRLDVVKIHRGSTGTTTAAVAAESRGKNECLLSKLRGLRPGGAAIDRDACER